MKRKCRGTCRERSHWKTGAPKDSQTRRPDDQQAGRPEESMATRQVAVADAAGRVAVYAGGQDGEIPLRRDKSSFRKLG